MRNALVALTGLLLASCAASASSTMPVSSGVPEAPLLTNEGGILRPVDNGARLPLRNGYATVRFTPSPQSMDPDLDISIFDASGRAVSADLSAEYESLDMDHGTEKVSAKPNVGAYRLRLSFPMPGSWRVVIHVVRGASEEKLTLVLPWVGL